MYLNHFFGYLLLAEKLFNRNETMTEAWNFGPDEFGALPVSSIIQHLCNRMPAAKWQIDKSTQLHEAMALKLDNSKAKEFLGWRPRWNIKQTIDKTVDWYLDWMLKKNMDEVSLDQIHSFEQND